MVTRTVLDAAVPLWVAVVLIGLVLWVPGRVVRQARRWWKRRALRRGLDQIRLMGTASRQRETWDGPETPMSTS